MKNLSVKKWVKLVVAFILSVLIILTGTVIYIDPFFVYHKPVEGLYYPYSDVMYQGAGIVKHFDYDTLVTGTSLIQNVKTSTVKNVFGDTAVKVPLCGMSFSKIYRLIELAVENNHQLEMVILNIDSGLLKNDTSEDTGFPDYLYDDNLFNDVSYLVNKSIVFEKSIECILNPNNQTQETFDSAFSSEKQFYFAEFAVKSHSIVYQNIDFKNVRKSVASNIELYESIVRSNPQIKFEFIIPPKSIMEIKSLSENNAVDFEVEILTAAVERLIGYDNVNIHMFQDDLEIIGNLYNYCDFQHFSSKVSDDILYAVKSKTELLTKENYADEISEIKTIAYTFDYSVFSAETYPVKGEENITDYLNIIADDANYEIYVSYYATSNLKVAAGIKGKFDLCGIDFDRVISTGGQYNQKIENKNNNCQLGKNGEILINGIDYSMGLPGINIVVYDKELGRVIDSSNFNGENLSECLRTKPVRKSS